MPILDLSAITNQVMSVTDRQGTTWDLSDQVSAEALMPTFDLLAIEEDEALLRAEAFTESTRENLLAYKDAMKAKLALVTDLCLAIWQASYPDMTAERLVALMPNPQQRREIVLTFFFLLSVGLRPPSAASSANDGETTGSAPDVPDSVPPARPEPPAWTPTTPTPAATPSSTSMTPTPRGTKKALQPKAKKKPASKPAPKKITNPTPGSPRGVNASSSGKPTAGPALTVLRPVPKTYSTR